MLLFSLAVIDVPKILLLQVGDRTYWLTLCPVNILGSFSLLHFEPGWYTDGTIFGKVRLHVWG